MLWLGQPIIDAAMMVYGPLRGSFRSRRKLDWDAAHRTDQTHEHLTAERPRSLDARGRSGPELRRTQPWYPSAKPCQFATGPGPWDVTMGQAVDRAAQAQFRAQFGLGARFAWPALSLDALAGLGETRACHGSVHCSSYRWWCFCSSGALPKVSSPRDVSLGARSLRLSLICRIVLGRFL